MVETARSSQIGVYHSRNEPYDQWIESIGIPIHRGYAFDDMREIEVAPWDERGCNAAFLVLAGQEGIQETRITEIPPGASLPPTRIAMEEITYVVQGRGLASVWGEPGGEKRSFEWQTHSVFMVPPNYHCQLSNAQGTQPARLLHINYLPLAMSIVRDPDFFFANDYVKELPELEGKDAFSEATVTPLEAGELGLRYLWVGNFFPDMKVWDKLEPHRRRGAGGTTVRFRSRTGRIGHMSVFPAGTYKMAHRHGPGPIIVIPAGEGYSIMWSSRLPDAEKVVVPWHEGSIFVPPDQWFHQHFNLGSEWARYMAINPPRVMIGAGDVEPLDLRQIPYTDEDPWIRETFESELAARGLTSLMPPECYTDPSYAWAYGEDG